MLLKIRFALGTALLLVACGSTVTAQPAPEPTAPKPAPAPAPLWSQTPVVATVGDEPIHAGEAAARFQQAFGKRQLSPQLLPRACAQVLEQLINERLIEFFVVGKGDLVSNQELDTAVADHQKLLGGKPSHVQQFLDEQGRTSAGWRRHLAGELGWPRYARQQITDEKLMQYFMAHQADFDGTEVRARQILLAIPAPQTQAEVDAVVAQAAVLRADILANKFPFEQAARQFSMAPSKDEGGELGQFPRHGKMTEAVSRAVFSLQDGEISAPVVTPFGVHLLQRVATVPGKKTWQDVREALVRQLQSELVTQTAKAERAKVAVTYTKDWPHLNEQGELATE